MNCQDIRRLESEAFDGRLDPESRIRFETHLGGCPDCAEREARYEALFTAVAALPALENERPVPYPETTRAFRRPEKPVSLARRAVSAAAMILVLSGIGYLAFEAGRRGAAPTGDERLEAVLDPESVVLPDLEGQRQLKRVEDRTRNLALVAELAPRYPDLETVRVLGHANAALRQSSLDLEALAPERLGSFHGEFNRLALSLAEICDELDGRLERPVPTEARLSQVREVVRRRELDRVIARLARVARAAPEIELETPLDGDYSNAFLVGLDQLGRGDAPRAIHSFQLVLQTPTVRDTQFGTMTSQLAAFVQMEIDGRTTIQTAVPLEFSRVVRSLRLDGRAVWILSRDSGGASLVGPGQQRIEIRRRGAEEPKEEPRPPAPRRPGKNL